MSFLGFFLSYSHNLLVLEEGLKGSVKDFVVTLGVEGCLERFKSDPKSELRLSSGSSSSVFERASLL